MSKKLGKKKFIANHPDVIKEGTPLNTHDVLLGIYQPCYQDDIDDLVYSDELQKALELFEKLKQMRKEDFLNHAAKLHGVSPEKLKELAILKKKTLKRMAPPELQQTITYSGSGTLFNSFTNASSSSAVYPGPYYPFQSYGSFTMGEPPEDDY